MLRLIRFFVVALLAVLPFSVSQANEGRLLAAQCAQCHGTDGRSQSDIDSLAGESYRELYEEMIEMKHERDNDIMHLQAKGYSERQIDLIARYFASLPGGGDDDDDRDDDDRDDDRDGDDDDRDDDDHDDDRNDDD